MNCKHCGARLERGTEVCPDCGMRQPALAEASAEENVAGLQKKVNRLKTALAVVLVLVLVAVLAVVVVLGLNGFSNSLTGNPSDPSVGQTAAATEPEGTVPLDGNPDDETCKGTYTDTDENVIANKDTVVATLGEHTLTNSQLQIFYWMQIYEFVETYGSYAPYFGLDYSKPLDEQVYDTETGVTWQQYFLKCAVGSWEQYIMLQQKAAEAGFQLDDASQEYLDSLYDSLQAAAEENKFASVEDMLHADMGAGCSFDDYKNYMVMYQIGNAYFAQEYEKIEVTPDEIEAFFTENEADLKANNITKDGSRYVDVRHILIQPEGGTLSEDGKTTTYTDAEWEACRVKAQQIYDEWLAGEANEDTFAEFAVKHSEDGNASSGGIYTNVYKGKMVEPFEEWCFDESRQYGDSGLVKTQFGYHIMFFVETQEIWERSCEESVLSEKAMELLDTITADSGMEVSYEKMNLCALELA